MSESVAIVLDPTQPIQLSINLYEFRLHNRGASMETQQPQKTVCYAPTTCRDYVHLHHHHRLTPHIEKSVAVLAVEAATGPWSSIAPILVAVSGSPILIRAVPRHTSSSR